MAPPSSGNPFFINTTSPDPFAIPLSALHSVFYPQGVDWKKTVVPQLYLLSALYAIYFFFAVGCIVTRWHRVSFRFFKKIGGYILPSTAIWFSLMAALFLIVAQSQIWTLIFRFRDEGSLKGASIARGLTWIFLAMYAWSHLHGLFLATSFNTRATSVSSSLHKTDTRMAASSSNLAAKKSEDYHLASPSHRLLAWLPSWISWPLVFNVLSFGFPIIFGTEEFVITVISEVVCSRQFEHFLEAKRVAKEGISNGINPELILRWYKEVESVKTSSCLDVNFQEYRSWLGWLSVLWLLNCISYTILSRKLKSQIALLRRSARSFRRVDNVDAALATTKARRQQPKTSRPPNNPSRSDIQHEGPEGTLAADEKECSPPQHVSPLPYSSYEDSTTGSAWSGSSQKGSKPLALKFSRSRPGTSQSKFQQGSGEDECILQEHEENEEEVGMRRQSEKQSKRADELENGLKNLRWQAGSFFGGCSAFIAHVAIVLHFGSRIQTEAAVAGAVNLLGLWIYAVIACPAIILLFFVGLAPERHSFLGIPLQNLQSTKTTSDQDSIRRGNFDTLGLTPTRIAKAETNTLERKEILLDDDLVDEPDEIQYHVQEKQAGGWTETGGRDIEKGLVENASISRSNSGGWRTPTMSQLRPMDSSNSSFNLLPLTPNGPTNHQRYGPAAHKGNQRVAEVPSSIPRPFLPEPQGPDASTPPPISRLDRWEKIPP